MVILAFSFFCFSVDVNGRSRDLWLAERVLFLFLMIFVKKQESNQFPFFGDGKTISFYTTLSTSLYN
jgi:hypothetical protein